MELTPEKRAVLVEAATFLKSYGEFCAAQAQELATLHQSSHETLLLAGKLELAEHYDRENLRHANTALALAPALLGFIDLDDQLAIAPEGVE